MLPVQVEWVDCLLDGCLLDDAPFGGATPTLKKKNAFLAYIWPIFGPFWVFSKRLAGPKAGTDGMCKYCLAGVLASLV